MLLAHSDVLVLLIMAATLPFGLDPFTNITNVHWAGGLAVEFGPKDQDAPGSGK